MPAIALPVPSTLPSLDPACLESTWTYGLPLLKDACSGLWQTLLASMHFGSPRQPHLRGRAGLPIAHWLQWPVHRQN